MITLDLNCDLGEGAGHDAELMALITSANIACGGHAGDAGTMKQVLDLAKVHGVQPGAHPGFEDREQFGRRELTLSPADIRELLIRQIEALQQFGAIRHVKPHGALYNLAARDRAVAYVIAQAVWDVDRTLVLFGLANSELVHAGRARGLIVAEEVFGDRTYQSDGTLTSRSTAGAVIEDEKQVLAQVLQMVHSGTVRSVDGRDILIRADTLCLHGDGPHAVTFAKMLRRELSAAGVAVQAFGRG